MIKKQCFWLQWEPKQPCHAVGDKCRFLNWLALDSIFCDKQSIAWAWTYHTPGNAPRTCAWLGSYSTCYQDYFHLSFPTRSLSSKSFQFLYWAAVGLCWVTVVPEEVCHHFQSLCPGAGGGLAMTVLCQVQLIPGALGLTKIPGSS